MVATERPCSWSTPSNPLRAHDEETQGSRTSQVAPVVLRAGGRRSLLGPSAHRSTPELCQSDAIQTFQLGQFATAVN